MSGLFPLLLAICRDRNDLDLGEIQEPVLRHALSAGLGPLLYRASRANPSNTDNPSFPLLHGCDLTARLLTGALLDASEEILVSDAALAQEITLLKGISICENIYPEPHLRTMADIDLLIPRSRRSALETLLGDLGYRQESPFPAAFYATHHHSMPFHNPRRGVWVEVHTHLFPATTTVWRDAMFDPASLLAHREPFRFRGAFACRFEIELRLAYICSHMAEHLTFLREPFAFIDLMCELKRYGPQIDWDRLLSRLGRGMAAAHLDLLLDYLRRRGLVAVPPEVIRALSAAQPCLNGASRRVLHGMIDGFLLNRPLFDRLRTRTNVKIAWEALLSPRPALVNFLCLPWSLLFPPQEPKRFHPLFQARRLGAALGLRGRRSPDSTLH